MRQRWMSTEGHSRHRRNGLRHDTRGAGLSGEARSCRCSAIRVVSILLERFDAETELCGWSLETWWKVSRPLCVTLAEQQAGSTVK